MPKYYFLFLIAVFFLFPFEEIQSQNDNDWTDLIFRRDVPFRDIQSAFDKEWKGKPYEKGHGINAFKRFEYLYETRLDQDGNIIGTESYQDQFEQIKDEGPEKKSKANGWSIVGPLGMPQDNNGVGRVNTIAFDPNNSNIMYAGTPAGGLWKTFNGGNYWISSSDNFQNLGVSDIVIDPTDSNVLYAVTGDNDGGDTSPYGIIKSTDGGITWNLLSLQPDKNGFPYFYRMDRILLNPINTNILYVSTNDAIYKSVDAGTNWTEVLNIGLRIRHMEFHPTNPNIIYATTDDYNPNGNRSDFYVSYNGGITWIQTPIPDN